MLLLHIYSQSERLVHFRLYYELCRIHPSIYDCCIFIFCFLFLISHKTNGDLAQESPVPLATVSNLIPRAQYFKSHTARTDACTLIYTFPH